MREGELLGLQWEHVDLPNGWVTVIANLQRNKDGFVLQEPKTKSGRRIIPLSAIAVAALEEHQQIQEREKVAAGNAWNHTWNLVFAQR